MIQPLSNDEIDLLSDEEEEDDTDKLINAIDLENDDDIAGFLGAVLDG